MANFDWEQFKDYAWDGGDVQACYAEIHSGENRQVFCVDISHTGLSTLTEGQVLLGVHVIALFITTFFYALYVWRKSYKPHRI
tara:strand:+ start:8436 stop:8684 length:249 start_codon:yes stop_codon:yes gene_type:complete